MRASTSVATIALIVLALYLPSTALASAEPPCPTYQVNLIIDLVDSNPRSAWVGVTVATRVHVTYPDGTPAVLMPETISFSWSNGTYEKIRPNALVMSTGEPGFYMYLESVKADFPTGSVTITALLCSCSDIGGNWGPTDDESSLTTITPSDLSILQIGLQMTTQTTTTQPAENVLVTYTVPIVIAILLLIALLLLFARGRRKKP